MDRVDRGDLSVTENLHKIASALSFVEWVRVLIESGIEEGNKWDRKELIYFIDINCNISFWNTTNFTYKSKNLKRTY